jgi:glutamate-ammonia-ligase adenylyltransferase
MMAAVEDAGDFGRAIAAMRRTWAGAHFELMTLDAAGLLPLAEAKKLQTRLAEASIAAAIRASETELSQRYRRTVDKLPLAVMGLGKLGSGGIDYDSDLDLVMVHGPMPPELADAAEPEEFFARAVENFVTALSSVTRDGSLYRIDLRLRPHGRNGRSSIAADAFGRYVETQAAIWELLAFVKLRAAGGDIELGRVVESDVRAAIHRRAAATDAHELAEDTRRVRARLEKERAASGRGEVDIKFGEGGMLDIYFAVRYLQLRDNLPDDGEVRSTGSVLSALHERGSLGDGDYNALRDGYEFLSALDHLLRLTIGRTTRLPHLDHRSLETAAARLGLASPAELQQRLTFHRLEVRSAFEHVLRS